jgi:hypothetical protein
MINKFLLASTTIGYLTLYKIILKKDYLHLGDILKIYMTMGISCTYGEYLDGFVNKPNLFVLFLVYGLSGISGVLFGRCIYLLGKIMKQRDE